MFHPLRVQSMRNVTLPVTVLWAATSLRLVTINSEGDRSIVFSSPIVFLLWVLSSFYFLFLCLSRSFEGIFNK